MSRVHGLFARIALVLALAFANTALFAAPAFSTEQVQATESEPLITTEEVELDSSSLADSDELAAGYIESILYADTDAELSLLADYGSSYFSGEALNLYTGLKELVQDLAANGGTASYSYSVKESATTSTYSSIASDIKEELNYNTVWRVLLADCPYDFYWFDKTEGVSTTISTSFSGSAVTVKLTMKFTVSSDYASSTYVVNASKAASTATAVANAKAIVAEYASVANVKTKLTAYKDEILALVDYDDEAAAGSVDYGDPWQIIYVFDGDTSTNVVCEGYSKAFQYLCDLTWPDNDPVTCYTVSGTLSGGGHMWNLIRVSSKSYLVDLTNSDTGAVGSSGQLFLVGSSSATGSASAGYTFSIGSYTLTYVYDADDAIDIYGTTILTLSSSSFPSSLTGAGSGAADLADSDDADDDAEDSDSTDTGGATSLSGATLSLSSSSYTFSGSACKPTVTVKLNGTTLSSGTDYTVSYSNNVNAGTATVKVTGTGSYTGTASTSFTIKAQSLSSSRITLSATSYTYNGTARKPTVTVKNAKGTTITKGTDYTLSYSSGRKNVGTYKVTVTGTGNYTGTISKYFTVTAASLSSATATLSATTYYYNGSAKKPGVTVKMTLNSTTTTLTKGTDYTVSYASGRTNIGTYKVTITGTGNFTGTLTRSFKVLPKQASISSAKSSAKKKLTVKWGKVAGGVSYQIAYKKKGASSWIYKTVSSSTYSKTLTGLTSGKYYYVKVRAYKTVSGTTYYGSWSATKTVKVK